MPEISIVMPVYNLSKHLENGIKSILNQTFKHFELILINDGSTDNSLEICKKMERKDNRVIVIDKINEGSGPTRNRGIQEAQGKYIMFLDGDDWIEKNMLERLYFEIHNKRFDLVICNYSEVVGESKDKRIFKQLHEDYIVEGLNECRKTYVELLKDGLIKSPWNKIYRLDLIKDNHIIFPDLRRCQDTVFNCLYFEHVNRYKVIKDSLYNYRVNDIEMELVKFPINYFDISIIVNETYIQAINKWGVMDEKSRSYLATYFINDVLGCIACSFSDKWGFNWKQRKDYINNIITNKKTQESIVLSEGNNKYKQLMKYLIENKHSFLIMLVMKVVIIIKLRMKSLFRYLKGRMTKE